MCWFPVTILSDFDAISEASSWSSSCSYTVSIRIFFLLPLLRRMLVCLFRQISLLNVFSLVSKVNLFLKTWRCCSHFSREPLHVVIICRFYRDRGGWDGYCNVLVCVEPSLYTRAPSSNFMASEVHMLQYCKSSSGSVHGNSIWPVMRLDINFLSFSHGLQIKSFHQQTWRVPGPLYYVVAHDDFDYHCRGCVT